MVVDRRKLSAWQKESFAFLLVWFGFVVAPRKHANNLNSYLGKTFPLMRWKVSRMRRDGQNHKVHKAPNDVGYVHLHQMKGEERRRGPTSAVLECCGADAVTMQTRLKNCERNERSDKYVERQNIPWQQNYAGIRLRICMRKFSPPNRVEVYKV